MDQHACLKGMFLSFPHIDEERYVSTTVLSWDLVLQLNLFFIQVVLIEITCILQARPVHGDTAYVVHVDGRIFIFTMFPLERHGCV